MFHPDDIACHRPQARAGHSAAAHTLGGNPFGIGRGFFCNPRRRSGVTIISSSHGSASRRFLGSQRQQMLAQVVQSEIDVGADWALAAALGITLAVVATIIVTALSSVARYLSRWQRPGLVPLTLPQEHVKEVDKSLLRRPVKLPPSRLHILAGFRVGARLVEPIYLCVISVFILLPLVVLIPASFSSAEVLIFPPPGYSLRWFETIFGSQEWIAAALTSLRISAATCVATFVIATLTVLGFGRHFHYQGAADSLLLSPLTVPSVVFALGAYLAFARVALVDTETGIIIAHTVLIFPIVYLVASATYSSIDPWLSLAAASLGANPWRIFRTIVFPLLLPGLGVGTLLAMLLSFDESVASIFLSNLSVKTLPRKLWEGIHFNTSPDLRPFRSAAGRHMRHGRCRHDGCSAPEERICRCKRALNRFLCASRWAAHQS
jgi:putative spermidine/putrescine transport system permease protein